MPVHPTAIVDPNAEIDPSAEIGPYAIVEANVKIGPRTRVMPHAFITGHTTIGADNQIGPGAVIGHDPQHLDYKGDPCYTVIGDRNVIREYSTIHGSYVEGGQTIVGDDNYIMVSAHVAHDCHLGNKIVMCNGSAVGGHIDIEDQVFISGLVAVHQFSRIGRLAMLAGVTRVDRDVPPFMMVFGLSEIVGMNLIGMRRAGISPAARAEIKKACKILYEEGRSLPYALKQLKSEPRCPEVQHMIEFLEGTKRGICKWRQG